MSIDDDKELQEIVVKLASKPGHENVRAVLYDLLVRGLGVDLNQVHLEKHLKEVRGRMDALLGRTIIEIKSDLNRELKDAEVQLLKYLQEKESGGEAYIGIATDGALFRVYERKNRNKDLTGDGLEIVSEYKLNLNNPRLLLIWLESALALNDKLLPEAHVIKMELGRESVFYRRSLKELRRLWQDLQNDSETETKYSIWQRLLNTAYGSEVEESDLFLQHSYLTFVAKAIATVALLKQTPANAEDFLSGEAFKKFGIFGAIESDFFDWVLSHDDGKKLVVGIASYVKKFNWDKIEADILKILYESLVDPAQRHELGEYYTPDWLAEKVCRKVITDPLNMRVIDPACGSGTFLFHAIRLGLKKARDEKLSESETVRRLTENVAGIDVHPIAVIFARVTYLLALLPALQQKGGNIDIDISVYMGDSLQWNLREFLNKDDLEIYVPARKEGHQYLMSDDSNGSNKEDIFLKFPHDVAMVPKFFNDIIMRMQDLSKENTPVEEFKNWLLSKEISSASLKILSQTYKDLCFLQKEKRDHIWGYVARNLSRPIWLSGEKQKADVVIGNPPWLRYSNMEGNMKKRFSEEMKKSQIWVGGKVATSQDLSSYFFIKACEFYMKKEGKIAFILPYATMSRLPYKKFRGGRFLSKNSSVHYFCFTEAWALSADVYPLFPVPACVLFAKNVNVPKDLPEPITNFAGELPRRDANTEEAEKALIETQVAWPEDSSPVIKSIYAKAFRQGAILAPRRLVLIERIPNPFTPNAPSLYVKGKAGKLDKMPWREIEPPQEPIEKDFIFPTYLGESIAPYRVLRASEAVIPWNESGQGNLMNANMALSKGYEKLYHWLKKVEKLWEDNKPEGENGDFLSRINHQHALSAQFPIASIRVVYATSGTQPAATILKDKNGIVDTKLYWTKPDSIGEAYYLIAILNSETTRAACAKWQSEGQWGKRDFHKVMFNLPIPKFDNENSLHQKLSTAAKTAEKIANKTTLREGLGFKANRLDIRKALREHGIADEIDRLVAELLAVNS